MSYEIKHFESVAGTPATAILVRGWNDLIVHDLITPHLFPLNWDDEAFVAFNAGGRAIGVISFGNQKWSREIVIKIGYVEQVYRRQGLYRQLWQKVVEHAQAVDVPTITGGTMVHNKPMRATARAFGREENMVMLHFNVPPKETKP